MYHRPYSKKNDVTGVILLGACTGEEIEGLKEDGIQNIIAAECNPHLYDKHVLPKLGENDYLITNAVSNVDHEEVTFYLIAKDSFDNYGKTFDNPGCSSLMPLKDHLKYYPQINHTEETMVETITVDTFIKENNIDPTNYQMLMMDLQGGELNALLGMKETIKNIKYVYTEITHPEMYEGGVTSKTLINHLRDLGFELKEYFPMHTTWGDAIFERV